jgi:hypothetical protein
MAPTPPMALELYEKGNISIIKLYVIYILHKLIKNNNLIINLFISSNNSKFVFIKLFTKIQWNTVRTHS